MAKQTVGGGHNVYFMIAVHMHEQPARNVTVTNPVTYQWTPINKQIQTIVEKIRTDIARIEEPSSSVEFVFRNANAL